MSFTMSDLLYSIIYSQCNGDLLEIVDTLYNYGECEKFGFDDNDIIKLLKHDFGVKDIQDAIKRVK